MLIARDIHIGIGQRRCATIPPAIGSAGSIRSQAQLIHVSLSHAPLGVRGLIPGDIFSHA